LSDDVIITTLLLTTAIRQSCCTAAADAATAAAAEFESISVCRCLVVSGWTTSLENTKAPIGSANSVFASKKQQHQQKDDCSK